MAPFETEYQQEPPATSPLDDLAREYRDRTEGYDRTVCTGPVGPGGGVLPADPREAALIDRHAAAVRKELWRRAEALGVSREEFRRAMSRADH
jgi:hypothetical protein